jgi:hypothetical protein
MSGHGTEARRSIESAEVACQQCADCLAEHVDALIYCYTSAVVLVGVEPHNEAAHVLAQQLLDGHRLIPHLAQLAR